MIKRTKERHSEETTAIRSADPVRNFSLTVDERIRAMSIGAPAWATRKKRIEDEEERLVGLLLELRRRLETKGHREEEIAERLGAAAASYDVRKLNELVAIHNRYYPIEANLPMDREGGGYLVYGRPWRPEEPYTPERLLRLLADELS